jgi:hypothetical protein
MSSEANENADVTNADVTVDYAVETTEAELAAAFTEWDRRYREEPERFMSEAVHLLKTTPESYGEQAAPYLVALLEGRI